MTISRFALLAALTLTTALFLIPAPAQTSPPNAPMHRPQGTRARAMADSMHFTDAQKAQLRAVLMGAGQQAQALRANTSLTPSARQTKMLALQQKVRAQMMAILTPAQRTRAMQQAQRQGHPM